MELSEIKNYLRIDFDDDDELLKSLQDTAISICESVVRDESLVDCPNLESAILYVIATLYENREQADQQKMMLNLRALLFTHRKAAF